MGHCWDGTASPAAGRAVGTAAATGVEGAPLSQPARAPSAESEHRQPSAKVRRVGILSALSGPLSAQGEFGRALGELGYVEGRDFVIEPRYANGRYDRLPSIAAELVRLNVDVILTGEPTTESTQASTHDACPAEQMLRNYVKW